MDESRSEQILQVLTAYDLAIVEALATYARGMINLGERDGAIEGMARAVSILSGMEDAGRITDSALHLINVEQALRNDGIYDDVLTRARQMGRERRAARSA